MIMTKEETIRKIWEVYFGEEFKDKEWVEVDYTLEEEKGFKHALHVQTVDQLIESVIDKTSRNFAIHYTTKEFPVKQGEHEFLKYWGKRLPQQYNKRLRVIVIDVEYPDKHEKLSEDEYLILMSKAFKLLPKNLQNAVVLVNYTGGGGQFVIALDRWVYYQEIQVVISYIKEVTKDNPYIDRTCFNTSQGQRLIGTVNAKYGVETFIYKERKDAIPLCVDDILTESELKEEVKKKEKQEKTEYPEYRDVIDEIKRRLRIVDVFQLNGTKSGNRWDCLCPIHPERNPSFKVFENEETGDIAVDYHGREHFSKITGEFVEIPNWIRETKDGLPYFDIIDLYRFLKKKSFKEAVSELAQLAGVEIKVKDEKKKVRDISLELLQKYRFIYEGSKGDFWVYDEDSGIWKPDAEDFIENVLRKEYEYSKSNFINEVIKDVRSLSWKPKGFKETPNHIIPLNNGVYDLKEKKFKPHSPDYYLLSKIPWNYNPDADPGRLLDIIHSFVPEDKRIDLLELMAYTLYRGYEYQKFFFLYGRGSNGKSLFISILTKLLGKENVSNIPLEDLQESGFAIATLRGKFANIAGEINYNDLENVRLLKQLTGGDIIHADRKYKNPVEFVNTAKLIFSTNYIPKTHDTTDAFYRRVFLIHFPYVFKPDTEVERFIGESKKEFEGLLYYLIQILQNLYDRGCRFTNDKSVDEMRYEYERLSNPIIQFIEDYFVKDPDGYVYKYEFTDKLNEWLEKRGLPRMFKEKIGKEMKELGFEDAQRKSGDKRYWVWLGLRWKNENTSGGESEYVEF